MSTCPHDSLSGDEGPVRELGRMPVRWRCDECETIVNDDVNKDGPRNRANHDGRWDTWAGRAGGTTSTTHRPYEIRKIP